MSRDATYTIIIIMRIVKTLLIIFLLTSSFWLVKPALAVTYSLVAPAAPPGGFVRGQDVQFTINLDTTGESITSTQIGLTYDTQYLQYVSTTPGETMTSVSVSDLGGGQLLFTGTNSSGFSGSGTFASVTFNIAAQAPGSTELCVLWAPSPTPQPTTPPGQPTTAPGQPTNPPQPTSLPTSGNVVSTKTLGIIGGFSILFATASYFVSSRHFFYKKRARVVR